jgi:organic radical activating enzyme
MRKFRRKRLMSSILRYAIINLLRPGINITIIPSYACNFNCVYCTRDQLGETPKAKVKSFDDWKDFLLKLNASLIASGSKLKSVVVNGGEPTLLPYFVELCNWMLDQGWMVNILTNLSRPVPLVELKQSPRLIIHASYHHGYIDQKDFNRNWRYVDYYHRVEVKELGERKLEGGHKKTSLCPISTFPKIVEPITNLRFDPNQQLYFTCLEDVTANVQ